MRRPARKPRADAGVSLFPFLAVLLCTIGALVVLLVVLAQQARVQAVESDAHREEALRKELDRIANRRQELDRALAEFSAQLAARRDQLRQLDEQVERIDRQLGQLMKDRGLLQQTIRSADDREPLAKQLDWYSEEIAKAQEALRRAKQKLDHARNAYAIVPYIGAHGTQRRPIYIECTSSAVILQPEGTILRGEDFVTLGRTNPLAAALRATMAQLAQRDPGEDKTPYPLLLVRPGGIYSYVAAQAVLRSAGFDYGYELIDGDWDLAFPETDPRLSQTQAQAVAAARMLQKQMVGAAARRQGSRNEAKSFRVAPRGGGLVPLDSSDEPGGGFGFGGPGGQPGGFADQRRRAAAGERPKARYYGFDFESGGYRDSGSSSVGQFPGSGGGTAGAGGGGDPFNFGSEDGSSSTGTGDPSNGNSGPSPGRKGPDDGGAGASAGGPSLGSAAGPSQGPFDPSASGPPGAGDARQPQAGAPNQSSGAAESGSQTGRSTAAAGSTANRAGQPSQSSSGASSGSPSSGSPPGGGMGQGAGGSGGRPSVSVAQRRGENWALPGASRSAVAITRPVRMRLTNQMLEILGPTPAAPMRAVIRLKPNTADSVDELKSAIWREMDSWGIAGRGMYWKPVLRVDVTPSGINRFDDLNMLFQGSGFDLRFRHLHETNRPSPGARPSDSGGGRSPSPRSAASPRRLAR